MVMCSFLVLGLHWFTCGTWKGPSVIPSLSSVRHRSITKTTMPVSTRRRSRSMSRDLTEPDTVPNIKKRNRNRSIDESAADDSKKKVAVVTEPTFSKQQQQQPTMIDTLVHRLRHLNYQPSPILCITSTSEASKQQHRDTIVALTRANGSLELRSVRQHLRLLTVIAGDRSVPVHHVVWVKRKTGFSSSGSSKILLGASRNGTLFVVDWTQARLRSVTPSGGGAITCLVALKNNFCPGIVAVGCEDGAVRLFSVEEGKNESLQVVSTLPTTGSPVVSMAWIKFSGTITSSSATSLLDGTTLFVGVADGTIRRYDNRSGSWHSTLRMTVECLGRSTPTRVWALLALNDGTVVSGDSLGHVQFWDGHTGTLQASLDQNPVKADVVALAVTKDERKVFATGVDSRVVCMERGSATSSVPAATVPWILTTAQRPHTHDVNAVAVVCNPNKNRGEFVLTGGLDTKLCWYNAQDFCQRPRTIYPWPSASPISIASRSSPLRVVCMQHEDRIELHDLAATPEKSTGTTPLLVHESNYRTVGTIALQSSLNLQSSCISPDGRFLALNTAAKTMLFRLSFTSSKKDGRQMTPQPIGLGDLSAADETVTCISFIDEHHLVLAYAPKTLVILAIEETTSMEEDAMELSARIQQTILLPVDDNDDDNNDDNGLLPVCNIAVSSNWLVAMQASAASRIHVYHRRSDETDFEHWWTLPHFVDAPASALALGAGTDNLIVACVNFASYVFQLEQKELHPWSAAAGFPATTTPIEFAKRKDYPLRIGINPSQPDRFFVVSVCFACACEYYPQGVISDTPLCCVPACHPCNSTKQ